MHRRVLFSVTLTLVWATTAASNTTGAMSATGHSWAPEVAGIAVQSYEEALAQDLALVAGARGWTIDEAQAYYRAEQAIGRIAEKVAAERPEAFVGSALSSKPDGAPTLYIKGPADKLINELVDAAGIEVLVADNQPFSFAQLEERKIRVHRALQAQGFGFVVTGVNITGAGVLKARVTREPGLPATADTILSALPADLRADVELSVRDVPIVVDEGAFGGMWMLDGGFNECTSGWTVQKVGSSTRGVSTAAHCTSIDQINHPGHGLHATIWQAPEHQGQWGDVEWHTTTQAEADDFYADAANIRDVAAVEPRANIAVNESICVYGRSSNDRDCTLDVLDVSMACGALDRLVQMDGDTQIGGDSGGGWSFNFTAYGGHYGNCGGLDSFTVADLFDEAIGVFVPTT